MRFACLLPALGFVVTSCIGGSAGQGRHDDGDAGPGLYNECESHDDCRGTGLLCDERRGCVECLGVDDCSSGESCRLGVCQSDGQGAEKMGNDAATDGNADRSSGNVKRDDTSLDDADGGARDDEPMSDADDAPSDVNETDDATTDDRAGPTDDSPAGPIDDASVDSTDAPDAGGPNGGNGPNAPEGACVMRLQAIYRDFSESHPDFGDNDDCSGVVQGTVASELDAEGRPVLSPVPPTLACVTTSQNFSQWYRDGGTNNRVVKDLLLFDDGNGGFVNRYGANGERFEWSGGANEEHYPGGATLDACHASCRQYVMNESFNAGCVNYCNPQRSAVLKLQDRLEELQAALEDPELLANDAGVAPSVGELEAEIARVEADLAVAEVEQDACMTSCENDVDAAAAECAATCLPCSDSYDNYCTGGELLEYDGTPLFFPLDDATGPTADFDRAKLPDVYGLIGWPWEDDVFPDAPEHNFYFTTEVHATLTLATGTEAELEFVGDDDLWVFINDRLALDVGGVHVPSGGTVTIQATAGSVQTEVWESDFGDVIPVSADTYSLSDFGLAPGGTYTVSIFHAERQKEGSSFRLRLTGFDENEVECQ